VTNGKRKGKGLFRKNVLSLRRFPREVDTNNEQEKFNKLIINQLEVAPDTN
jgi:hypothetical protein